MSKELIGVIVPVYKVEKYVVECIESILAQTYTKFRLILVDDGTPDNAGKICDEYAKKDSRITVIHQENAGVTRARARGVEEASDCEWITFVDSDDTLFPDALQKLTNRISTNTDIILSEFVSYMRENIHIPIEEYRKELIYEKYCSLCGKLFRRCILNNMVFNTSKEIYVGEDMLTNLRISFNTSSDIVVIKEAVYNYRYNEESCINTYVPTIEYEILFHNTLLKTISQYDSVGKYLHSHIKRRLLWWDRLFGYHHKKPLWFGSKYHAQLISDIKLSNYPIGKIELRLLKTANPIMRFIFISARKIKNKVTKLFL